MSVSLKIKGNKRGNEGVGIDLVSIGDPRFPVIDQQYPGVGSTTDFIVVRHLLDKSVYTIVTKNVTPCDSSRSGVLMISLSVPVGERVDRLFNLLIELSGFYKSTYMSYDGSQYHFTTDTEDAAGFEAILSRHQISPYPYRPVRTADDTEAVAYLYMTSSQIADLLDDPMRNEFAAFGQVVLVPVADPASVQSTLNIAPKMEREYKIFVNGRPTAQSVSDPSKIIAITIPENKDYNAASARFTLDEARRGTVAGIVADDMAQVIYVKLQPSKKEPVITAATVEPADIKTSRTPRRRSMSTAGVIAIGVIVIAAIGAACWFLGVFKSGEKNPATGEAPSTMQEIQKDKEREMEREITGGDDQDLSDEEFFNSIPSEDQAENDKKEGLSQKESGSDAEGAPRVTPKPAPAPTQERPTQRREQPTQRQEQPAGQANEEIAGYLSQLKGVSFTYSDLENISRVFDALPESADKMRLKRLIDFHNSAIATLTAAETPSNAAITVLATKATAIGNTALADKLTKLVNDSKNNEDAIGNYGATVKSNIGRNKANKPVY